MDREKNRALMISLLEKLQALKKRLNEFSSEEDEIYEVCKKRLTYLNSSLSPGTAEYMDYQKIRINRMLVEYLARQGLTSTPERMISQFNLQVISFVFFE
eukprot:TRINITY_DN5891_c0_g1_i5.p1 TRINITY_DN5891_c0_g1~~TRINITY_DN5891_c0_g1_i5.p1  ORF type:complete len:100 (-),score=15.14 TRINITY_DN5891_c0_g1_i5:488-787(-)